MSKKKTRLQKTLVEKILDRAKITYEQKEFNLDDPAAERDDQAIIYKTLVLHGEKTGPLVGVVPLNEHLDERKLAEASGNKRVRMIPLKELAETSGYVHGANTPIGIYEQDHFPIYIDQSVQNLPAMMVSSGKLGRSVKLVPQDLIDFVEGTVVDLTVKSEAPS
ncbi:transcriptional regulator [Lapidilactobacillus dextrinicus DSM 20335]|uniref:Cys-tRNA(Pro)/Cys-tRNA(Cys) deacylase n=1 Tax=Lapidilactobacillus dextrinicus DSM 20335 TaxID=1423738 RepID=A0A0R2BSZ0_9LACO|nr:aminoacyl-tRNA deacylase [Lapidilactobacillus dextrinicus]KRM79339.1 transcriptional regulator [Lapidilactobacillus dextrinicus DSM 20335]QFG46827.1 aminoacyl-tRNA deacylase [Lapidilactobacillus dextrinicus]